ncbi:MAG: prephenate dehydrogenase/arogenate dehydrogenase family protein [Candidatus Bathyarchaeota archaeon]|nr:prephenate dehydrogenase/arogenate dehydrogenase family protein [Candidatus Bathyarchaeota archaeon]
MKVAIIGAGKMGRWFTRFFLEEGDSVIVSSRSKEKLLKIRDEFGVEIADNVSAVKKADRVLICVPIENFEAVAKEIQPHIRPDQVVMDICSIKEFPVKIMHEYVKTGITLGTHPVFGPGVKSIENQNFVLTPVNDEEKRFAREFKSWLEERRANVFIMSPRKHDELMSVVLGLPHFLGLVVCDTLMNYPNFLETKKVAGASYKMLLTLAEAVASEETEFYTSLQMDLPEIEKIEGLFLEKTEEWINMVRRKNGSAFISKMELVKTKLKEVNPDYARSYEVMHRLLGTVKS